MTAEVASLDRLIARDEIRQLAYRYADAVDRRDLDLMASIYAPEARFAGYGDGPDACRAFFDDALSAIGVAVLMVTNHLIEIEDADHAHGTVWCHGHIADRSEGFIEQLIRYDDRYVRVDGTWLFLGRRHRLWFGVARSIDPTGQQPANWPDRQVGIGDIPYDDPAWIEYWSRHPDQEQR